jgi:hypothetical protein
VENYGKTVENFGWVGEKVRENCGKPVEISSAD